MARVGVTPFLVEPLQRPRLSRLEPEVQVQQLAPLLRPPGEIVLEVHSREVPPQVNLVLLAVGRVVEHGVDVGEDVLGRDGVVAVVLAELPQPPLGDVAHPLAVRRVYR